MLEQMYLILVPKISVLGPNFRETTTEFSRHKSRIGISAVDVSRKFGSYMLHWGYIISYNCSCEIAFSLSMLKTVESVDHHTHKERTNRWKVLKKLRHSGSSCAYRR